MNGACAVIAQWGFVQWATAFLGALLFLYLAVRLGGHAYFRCKHDYESMKGEL